MFEQITVELMKNGVLGVLLCASWVVVGVIWKVWRKEAAEWDSERTALYQESRKSEQDNFALMIGTFQNINSILVEIKTMLSK